MTNRYTKGLLTVTAVVSALLLTSCSNPDTSGGVAVTMSRDNASEFPDGSCEGPGKFTDNLNTGCGWIYPNEKGYYIQPDANLYAADLYGANLRGAYLRGAYLSVAHLRDAILRDTDLRRANLRGADLRDADLSGADLRDANLSGADLSGVKADSSTICPSGMKWGAPIACPF